MEQAGGGLFLSAEDRSLRHAIYNEVNAFIARVCRACGQRCCTRKESEYFLLGDLPTSGRERLMTGLILDASFRRSLRQRLPAANVNRFGGHFLEHFTGLIDDAQALQRLCLDDHSPACQDRVSRLLTQLAEPFQQFRDVLFPAGERIFRWGPIHGCPFWYSGGCAVNEYKPWRCRGFYSRDRLLSPLADRFAPADVLRAHIAPVNREKLLQQVRQRMVLGPLAWEPLYIFGIRDAAPSFAGAVASACSDLMDFDTTSELAAYLSQLQDQIGEGAVPRDRGFLLHHHGQQIDGSALQHINVHGLVNRPVLVLFDGRPDQIVGGDFNIHLGGPTKDLDSGFLANEAYTLKS